MNEQLPPILDNVIELGVIRMRTAIGPSAAESYVARMCLWVDQRSGMIVNFELTEPQDSYVRVLVESLGTVAERLEGLPRQIQLRDPALAAELRPILARVGVEVVVRESLPMLDEAVASMGEFKGLGGGPQPALLDVPGMTLDHVIAFAEAAKAFYQARPWQHLIDDDLIQVESPAGPEGTQFTQVLGAGGQTYGLGFVASRKAHEEIRAGRLPRAGAWALLFGSLDEIPFDDGEAWARHNLPVAGPEAYAVFIRMTRSGGPTYPTPEQLAWAEGLLRALAATSEEELDGGRWEQAVSTSVGPMTFKLSMPLLLEQTSGGGGGADPAKSVYATRMNMESMLRGLGQQIAAHGEMSEAELNQFLQSTAGQPQPFVPTTDAERAQALCYQAYDSRGRRQVQLARQALAIDPDCCEALLLLAEWRAGDPAAAKPLLERALAAGARQLGTERFERDAGHFWGIVETRPYMRARQQMALTLMELGEFHAAAAHLDEMLRLNPGDNQGNRYHLAQCLLALGRLDELDAMLNRSEYKDDYAAEWLFTRVLLEYRRHGDSPATRKLLAEAQAANPHVAPMLSGRRSPPPFSPDSYSPGSEDEAVITFEQIADGWQESSGAIEWLREATKPPKRPRHGRTHKDKKRKKR